jgi:hypothetical protein
MRKVDDLGDHRRIWVNAVEPKHFRIQVGDRRLSFFANEIQGT